MKKRKLNPYSIFDEEILLNFLQENGIKQDHAITLWKFFIKYPNKTIEDCPDLPKV